MSGDYDDIMNLPYPIPSARPRMSMEDRAAQFSPFAALTGYEDAIEETGRQTSERRELSEEEKEDLDRKQKFLTERIGEEPEVSVTYFVPDERKAGGAYVTERGRLKKADDSGRWIQLAGGSRIPADEIVRLESGLFGDMDVSTIGNGCPEGGFDAADRKEYSR